MTRTEPLRRRGTRATWGMRLLVALGLLLVVDGAWLAVAVGGAELFESDTGVAMADVQREFPSVVRMMGLRGTTIGILVVGLGVILIASVVERGARRLPPAAAVRSWWQRLPLVPAAVAATLAALAGWMFGSGALVVAAVYLVFAGLGAAGCALSASGGAER